MRIRIRSVEFRNYKAFPRYFLSVQSLNVLVGPNNCGKSTIIGAFRLLASTLKRVRGKSPQALLGPNQRTFYGYNVPQENLPVSVENAHTDYADTDTFIIFHLSNGNDFQLYFPRKGGMLLLLDPAGKDVRNTVAFKSSYPITIAAVPVLGPVEHEEEFVQKETVQRGLDTHRASRHFRTYWRYNLADFGAFAEMVRETWPGMQIQPPEIDHQSSKLTMFCLENRITRELYWSGFGFQVWCQLLTHIARAADDSLLVIDEPEIYLHPDVQRELVNILRDLGPDVILATHSAEIIGEADPSEIVLVDKSARSAERLKDAAGVQVALEKIGSIHNVALARLARNRTLLFVESNDDFSILRRFARKLGLTQLAAGADLTPTASEGFSRWSSVKDFAWGARKTLDVKLKIGALFDRDYWSQEEITEIEQKLRADLEFAYVHKRKEIENYLLVPSVLERAVRNGIIDRGDNPDRAMNETVMKILERITEQFKSHVLSQKIARLNDYLKRARSRVDDATQTEQAVRQFEADWASLDRRLELVPGKEVLRLLREEVQSKYNVSLTINKIIGSFSPPEIPGDLVALLQALEEFRQLHA